MKTIIPYKEFIGILNKRIDDNWANETKEKTVNNWTGRILENRVYDSREISLKRFFFFFFFVEKEVKTIGIRRGKVNVATFRFHPVVSDRLSDFCTARARVCMRVYT